MVAYFLLAVSVVTEVMATSTLPATEGFTKLKPSLICAALYALCFFCFGHALGSLNLGIAYATWGAVGTVATPVIGYLFYHQRITKTGLFALVLIIGSVVVLNLYG
jgi:small multidrug resistance pump